MTDCVSREAVIDALDKHCDIVCEYSKKQRSVMCGACPMGTAFDVIDALPSVQPKSELKNIRAEIMSIGNWRRKSEIPNGYLVQAIEILDKHIGGE